MSIFVNQSLFVTNPVFILLHIVWHVVVDDVIHMRDMETSGCYSSGHQDRLAIHTEVEVVKSVLSLRYGHVTVDAGGGKPFGWQVSG